MSVADRFTTTGAHGMRSLIAGLGIAIFVVGCTNQIQTSSDSGGGTAITQAVHESQEGGEAAAQTPEAQIGQPAPSFEGLNGVDDQPHSLKDYADAKAVVVAFICNHCPVAVAYEDRLIALHDDYADKGVQLIAINVNNMDADKLPAMKERAEEKGFKFPYLYDPTQKVGRDYAAAVTPHVFVLDGERKFAFIGPIDDNQDESKVTETYVRDAVEAVLAGSKPETTNVNPVGCGIKYE
jgi:peroxiredoxin